MNWVRPVGLTAQPDISTQTAKRAQCLVRMIICGGPLVGSF